MLSETGGVMAFPSRIRKTLAAEPSDMCPSAFSTIASSKPARSASVLTNAELT
jgi:hypothetical protein